MVCKHCGADNAQGSKFCLYDLNGELYTGGFHLIRFKNGWKIESMTSYLAGTRADGSVIKTTEDEYLSSIE